MQAEQRARSARAASMPAAAGARGGPDSAGKGKTKHGSSTQREPHLTHIANELEHLMLEHLMEDSAPCCEGCNGRPWGVPCRWVACGKCGEAPTLHCGRCCPLHSFGVLRGWCDGDDTRGGQQAPSARTSWLGDSRWDLRRQREIALSEERWLESRCSDAERTPPPTGTAAMSFSVPVGTSWVEIQQFEKLVDESRSSAHVRDPVEEAWLRDTARLSVRVR